MKKYNVIPAAERFGLDRLEASEYIGIGTTLFDELVKDGRLPQPKVLNDRRVWLRPALEKALVALPDAGQTRPASPWRDGLRV